MDTRILAKNLGNFRRALLRLLIIAAVLWAGSYIFNQGLIQLLQRPLSRPLAYFKVTEAFYAGLKVSLYASIFLLMPLIFLEVWKFLYPLVWPEGKRHSPLITCVASLLFYSGAGLCYFIVLPSGIKFLLSYGQGQMEPLISVDRYLTFAVAFIFGFGLTFELPLAMLLLSRAGLVNHRMLAKNRRYAILIIVIVAAIFTPTPDIYNLSLMAGPLLILYEISLILVKFFGKKEG